MQEGFRSPKKTSLGPPFLRAIRAEGGTPRFTLKLGTSDMTIVGPAWNCPMVTYGPGDAALDHTPEERIDNLLKFAGTVESSRALNWRPSDSRPPLPASMFR